MLHENLRVYYTPGGNVLVCMFGNIVFGKHLSLNGAMRPDLNSQQQQTLSLKLPK